MNKRMKRRKRVNNKSGTKASWQKRNKEWDKSWQKTGREKRRTSACWPKKAKNTRSVKLLWCLFMELNLTLWRAWAMLLQTISFCSWLKTARLVVVAFWGRSTVLAWGISGQLVYVKTRMLVLWASWSVLASLLSSLMPGVGLIVEFFGSFDFDLSPKFQTVGPRRFVKGSGIRVLAKDGKKLFRAKASCHNDGTGYHHMVLALGSVVFCILSSSDFPWVCFQQSSFQTNSPCLVAEGGATGGRAGATARRKEKADVEQKLSFWTSAVVGFLCSGFCFW